MTLKALCMAITLKCLFHGGAGLNMLPFDVEAGPVLIGLGAVLFDGACWIIHLQSVLTQKMDQWLTINSTSPLSPLIGTITNLDASPPIFELGVFAYLLVVHMAFGATLFLIHGSLPSNIPFLMLCVLLVSIFKYRLLKKVHGGIEGAPISLASILLEACQVWIPSHAILLLSFGIQRAFTR